MGIKLNPITGQFDLVGSPPVSGGVDSVNGRSGDVVLNSSDVGLDQVDNTSDATKNAAAVALTNHTINADLNAISNIDDNDIKALAGISATKIADGSVSNAEFQYLDGVTSLIQTQINGKEPTISGATISDVWLGDKAFHPSIGLPISTATQTALDTKATSSNFPSKILYVSKNGSDLNVGGLEAPVLTIQKAIDLATAVPSTFSTPIVISISPGAYTEDLSFTQQGITLESQSQLYHSNSVQIFGGITVNLSGTAGGGNFSAGNNSVCLNGLETFATGSKHGILFSGSAFQRLFINQCFINQTTSNSAFSALLMSNTGTSGGTKSTITSRDTDWSNNSATNATIEMQAGRIFINGSSVDLSNSTTARVAVLLNGSAAAGPSMFVDHANITGQCSITDNTAVLQFSLVSISSGTNPCIVLPASPSTGFFLGGDNLFTTTNTNVISGTGIAVLSGSNYCGSTGVAIAGTVTQSLLVPLPQGILKPSGLLVSGLSASLPVKTDGSKNLTAAAINLASATEVTGTLPINKGGTASASALSGSSIMVSNGSAIIQGTAGTTTTVLHGNAAGTPTYSAVSLTADVSGILPEANGGTGAAQAFKTLDTSTSQVGNTAATETDIYTYAIPGGTLSVNGNTIEFIAGGTFTGSLSTDKQIKVKFGSTTIFDTGSLAVSSSSSWKLEGSIIRTGATTQKCSISFVSSFASLSGDASYSTAAETLSGSVNLKITGQGTLANDIVKEMAKTFFEL